MKQTMQQYVLRQLLIVLALIGGMSIATAQEEPENLLAARAGADLVHRTTESTNAPAAALLDDSGARTPWVSQEGVLPQTITFRLRANLPFNLVALNPAGAALKSNWAKTVAVATADPYPHMGGWRELGVFELTQSAERQTFAIPRTRGRFIRIMITAAHGAAPSEVSIAEIGLYLQP